MRAAGVGITPRIRRNRIQIMFGGLKGWRRVATQYDRRSTVFPGARHSAPVNPTGHN
ncbi:hypothetical protein [Caulobacter sp. SSI4214]|uniref:hypothetical protein n=1 Tax=Caulobacter sp. SSI4214 TaxID=2575739 RepID=UPI00143991D5|nr:hypothetical protein [Caulobacter sp. SSI4214]